jgi:hypothetical protein
LEESHGYSSPERGKVMMNSPDGRSSSVGTPSR